MLLIGGSGTDTHLHVNISEGCSVAFEVLKVSLEIACDKPILSNCACIQRTGQNYGRFSHAIMIPYDIMMTETHGMPC